MSMNDNYCVFPIPQVMCNYTKIHEEGILDSHNHVKWVTAKL